MKALYGAAKLQREYCAECDSWSFVFDGRLACCDGIAPSRLDNKPKRMSKMTRKYLSAAQRKTIILDQKGRCFYCGGLFGTFVYNATKDKLYKLTPQIDHIYPYLLGGTMDRGNLVASCAICNRFKRARVRKTLEEFRAYIKGRWDDSGYIRST